MYSEHWEPYNKYYGYDKREYDVQTETGKVISNCYPNAGKFESHNPKTKGIAIPEEQVKLIRLSQIELLDINPSRRKRK